VRAERLEADLRTKPTQRPNAAIKRGKHMEGNCLHAGRVA